jgi:hypothetical protein
MKMKDPYIEDIEAILTGSLRLGTLLCIVYDGHFFGSGARRELTTMIGLRDQLKSAPYLSMSLLAEQRYFRIRSTSTAH